MGPPKYINPASVEKDHKLHEKMAASLRESTHFSRKKGLTFTYVDSVASGLKSASAPEYFALHSLLMGELGPY